MLTLSFHMHWWKLCDIRLKVWWKIFPRELVLPFSTRAMSLFGIWAIWLDKIDHVTGHFPTVVTGHWDAIAKLTSLLCCFSQIRGGVTQAHISKSITSCSTQRLSLTTTLLLQKLFIHWRFQTLPLKWYIGMGQIIESKSSEKQNINFFIL